jgi:GxxExxY protein
VITQKIINDISYTIIGCAIEVHKHLGPGLLESVYEPCFIAELKAAGLSVRSQIYLLINFNCETIKDHLLSYVTDEFAKFPRN